MAMGGTVGDGTVRRAISGRFVRAAAVAAFAFAASACSSIPFLGGNDTPAPSPVVGVPAPQGFPQVADAPQRAQVSTTLADREAIADGLRADQSRARYSADALRGGTEPVAPPPPPAPVETPRIAQAAQPAPAQPSATMTAPASAPVTSVARAAPVTAPMAAPTGPAAVPGGARVFQASAVAPGFGQAAVPRNDVDEWGFNRSGAPQLDPGVAAVVPVAVLQRYAATEQRMPVRPALAVPGQSRAAVPAAPQPLGVYSNPSVQVNLGAAGRMAAPGTGAAAVVYFGHGSASLSREDRVQLQAVAQAFMARGGSRIRVVGHASSRTGATQTEDMLIVNLQASQARAAAVAQELVRLGVPGERIAVEAVGAGEPVMMADGSSSERAQRRAEVFIE